jgi:hypothetical protein
LSERFSWFGMHSTGCSWAFLMMGWMMNQRPSSSCLISARLTPCSSP